jgi:uncharacterized protein YbaR (Trm112 family)
VKRTLLEYLRCPLCRKPLVLVETPASSATIQEGILNCTGCHNEFVVENGIPTMLAPQLPRYAEKMREASGWVALSKAQGWYHSSPEIDLALPDVVDKLGWDPVDSSSWLGTSHSFHDMFARFTRPGLRVLEIGAARTWAGHYFAAAGCTYTGCDIVADPQIGLGRSQFFMQHFNTYYEVVTADAEALPFADASFDLVFAIAALHHALDLPKMIGEMARVVKRGGIVAGLGEGVRSFRASPDAETQATEKEYGINEHVYTLWDYHAAFLRHRLRVTKIYRAAGDEWFMGEKAKAHMKRWRRLPWGGDWLATALLLGFFHPYDGISIYSTKW